MKTIFVALDLNASVENILDTAKDLARHYASQLILATVERELPGTEGAAEELVKDEITEAYGDDVHELHKLALSISEEGIECRALLMEGTTADQIVNASTDMAADLIVLGNHGHNPIYDTLIGSAIPGVIRMAKQKVLLVPVED